MSSLRKKSYSFTIALLVLIVIESFAFVLCKVLQKKGAFYSPESTGNYSEYIRDRDEILGWPAPKFYKLENQYYDTTGSRYVPAFPAPNRFPACISLYGDSFTLGSEVDHPYTWGNILSQRINCRVSNYGMSGYGTDQAYLRFKHNENDDAKVVILAHLSENIIRNVNQYRRLLSPENIYGFKPRFILHHNNRLRLIPIPSFSDTAYLSFARRPHLYLKNEYFIPEGPSGIQYLRIPYTYRALKVFGYFRVQSKLKRELSYAAFYRHDHPSNGLHVTSHIIQNFHREAKENDKIPIVIILPTLKDLVFYQNRRYWVYQNLIDDLSGKNLSPLNVGTAMINHLGEDSPKTLFATTSPHPNKDGNKVIASIVYNYLLSNKLISEN